MHPAWMAVGLALAVLALRAGLALRRAKRVGLPGRRALLQRHLRLAKPAVLLLVAGFVLGPISMAWLRDRAPFGTLHALAGVVAAALFVTAGLAGRRLEQGRGGSAEVHALLAIAALAAGGLAAIAGFVLLP